MNYAFVTLIMDEVLYHVTFLISTTHWGRYSSLTVQRETRIIKRSFHRMASRLKY